MNPIIDSFTEDCHTLPNGRGGYYTVLGHNGLTGPRKKYYVQCSVCGEDAFSIEKSKLLKGTCCCRCSPTYRRSVSQFEDFFTEYYLERGFEYLSHQTKSGRHLVMLQCKYHKIKITSIHNSRTPSCPVCKELSREGSYDHTRFFRNDLIVGYTGERRPGKNKILNYKCPDCSHDEFVVNGLCSGVFSITDNDLLKGHCACRCSRNYRYTDTQNAYRAKSSANKRGLRHCSFRVSGENLRFTCKKHGEQEVNLHKYLKGSGCPKCAGKTSREGYINLVVDNSHPVALKFGVSVSARRRIKQQNSNNIFKMQPLCIYTFPTVDSCLKAESLCKTQLKTGVVSKHDLRDGFTETTCIENLQILKKIFEECGGVCVRKS